jgi:hypothetical protein
MTFTSRQVLQLLAAGWLGIATAVPRVPRINTTEFRSDDIITRDICVIGGGSSGTYSAIRLREMGKSVVVVEKEGRLGGHTNTYTDPATGFTYDYGVQVFENITVVMNYFAHFNIPLAIAPFSSNGQQQFVDFSTGKPVTNLSQADPTAAFEAYGAQLAKYPYLNLGFDLPDPVPSELLLPFGDFILKYNLGAAVDTIAVVCQGVGDFLSQPTIYIMKYFSTQVLIGSTAGFLTTAHHDNSALYEAAQAELGTDVLLNSTVVAMDRDRDNSTYIAVSTPSGRKLIVAQKIVVAIPQKLDNLGGFDLDHTERSLFEQFRNSFYYTALISNTGIPDNLSINNNGANTPFNLPVLPGPYSIVPTGITGVANIFYGSATAMTNEQVQQAIVADILRLRNDNLTTTKPDFVAFSNHRPFELTVPADAIENGFYRRLNALQGHRKTYYTGAAFQAHDSSMIWNFTEALLPQIVA